MSGKRNGKNKMNNNFPRILEGLSESQKNIITDTTNNLYVTACPGSGKTRTLTRKIAYTSNLYYKSLKKIIALTYTKRAANEIIDRLEKIGVTEDQIWVGTIHQFCLDFILRKFGQNLERTSRGIKIIDEYITDKYLKEGCKELNIKYNPYNPPNLKLDIKGNTEETNIENIKLVNNYHKRLKDNNEIDFDLILTLSLKILEENPVASTIISNNIRAVYVDEFQDTNEQQYKIISNLAKSDNTIKFLFMGDSDQAIFTSIGGVAKTKNELEKITGLSFISMELNGCYRSTQRIVNLYSQFQQKNYKITSLARYRNKPGVVKYDTHTHKDDLSNKISIIIQDLLNENIPEEEICIIAPNQFLLAPITSDLKDRLPNVSFRSQDVYPIKPDDLNIFYKMSFLVFTTSGQRVALRKKIASEIIDSLKRDYYVPLNEDFKGIDLLDKLNSIKSEEVNGLIYLHDKITRLFIELEIKKEEFKNLFKQMSEFFTKTEERINNTRLNLNTDIENFRNIYKTKKGINISTIHKVKGEEYEVVIAFGFLEDIVPHFKSKNRTEESKKILYVAISRAKQRIYIFSERGRKNGNYPEKKPTKVLQAAEIL